MARNVEIKARVSDLDTLRSRVSSLAPGPSQLMDQIDTFFVVADGRLKVREFGDRSGELILYRRPDREGPKTSVYTRVGCEDAALLVAILSRMLTIRGVVVKRREVFLVGRTRVHLDQVEHLGSFAELEVVLEPDEPLEQGEREARQLMDALQIPTTDLVAGAYIDLLQAR